MVSGRAAAVTRARNSDIQGCSDARLCVVFLYRNHPHGALSTEIGFRNYKEMVLVVACICANSNNWYEGYFSICVAQAAVLGYFTRSLDSSKNRYNEGKTKVQS
jgi:hypothetical protein